MLHPYRESSSSERVECGCAARWDDYVLAGMLGVLGSVRVALAVANHEPFGTEATIAAVMLALGILLAITTLSRRGADIRHRPR